MAMHGMATVNRTAVPSGYVAFSNLSGCFGFVLELSCRGRASILCVTPLQPVVSLGTITVEGPGVSCRRRWLHGELILDVCNETEVSVTINGTTVSRTAYEGSTAAQIANGLATGINSNPSLNPLVGATVSSNVVTVFARQAGVEYSYPWTSSCIRTEPYFGSCAFQGKLSPIATMAPQD